MSESDESPENLKKKSFLHNIKRTQIANPDSDAVYNKVRRVTNIPVHKLRKIMFKKMLLKLISSFYESVIIEEINEEFSIYVYKKLVKKFIMIKAADNRYEYMLNSCIKYKYIPRVRLFGRLLQLYQPFDIT